MSPTRKGPPRPAGDPPRETAAHRLPPADPTPTPAHDLVWLDTAPAPVREAWFESHPWDREPWERDRADRELQAEAEADEAGGLDGTNQDGTLGDATGPTVQDWKDRPPEAPADRTVRVGGLTSLTIGPRRGLSTADLPAIAAALAAPFPPEHIDWRIGQSGVKQGGAVWAKALAYIDNRAAMNRLDAVVGFGNWRDEYKGVAATGDTPGGFLCGLSLLIEGEWVTWWDGAEFPDTEPFKGALSNAEKRAAVKLGIGRYLYNLPSTFVDLADREQRNDPGIHYQPKARARREGQPETPEFYWREPALPPWALPGGTGEPYNAPRASAPKAAAGPGAPPGTVPAGDRAAAGGLSGRAAPSGGYEGPGHRPPAVGQGRPAPANPDPPGPVGDAGGAAAVKPGAYAPTEKQVAFYQRLAESPVFTDEERRRALEWLATRATRQTIKDQIDWLKRQVEGRRPAAGKTAAADGAAQGTEPARGAPAAVPLTPTDPALQPDAKDWSPTASAAVRGEVDVHQSENMPSEQQVVFFCSLVDSHHIRPDERATAIYWLAKKATRPLMSDQIDRLQALIRQRTKEAKAAAESVAGIVVAAGAAAADLTDYEAYIRTLAARTGGPTDQQARAFLTLVNAPALDNTPRRRQLLSWSITSLTAANADEATAKLEREVEALESKAPVTR